MSLDAPATAGGSAADVVRLPGVAAAALRLEPCRAGVVVVATVPGVRVGGRAVPAGARRLLRPGEHAEVEGARVELPRPGLEATRAAAGALLVGVTPSGPGLLVLTGPLAGARAPLREPVVVGRGRGAGLRLPDPQASRRHARVSVRAGRPVVEDLGSKNGVRVNGVRLESRPAPLAPGDELVIGETALAFEDGSPPGSAAPPPAARAAARQAARPRRAGPGLGAAALLLALGAAALAAAAAGG